MIIFITDLSVLFTEPINIVLSYEGFTPIINVMYNYPQLKNIDMQDLKYSQVWSLLVLLNDELASVFLAIPDLSSNNGSETDLINTYQWDEALTLVWYKDLSTEEIWKNYSSMMSIRRPESVLPYDRFECHMMNHAEIIRYKDSIILWNKDDITGIFTPSHFCPASKREGLEMLSYLKNFDNIVFAITDDLAHMLDRLGYENLSVSIPSVLWEELITKQIFASNYDYIQGLMYELNNILNNENYKENNEDEKLITDDLCALEDTHPSFIKNFNRTSKWAA